MKTDKIIIFDTTLRDGEQSPGVSMSVDDKVKIAIQLEKMGYKFTDEQINQIFTKFKEIAGRKKFIVDEDIEKIIKECGF